mgnify:CR=1 FL=1
MQYALYLKDIKRYSLADKFYQSSIYYSSKNNQLIYRYLYGLFLVKQKKLEEAYEQAKIVYANNFSKQSLKKKLISAGVWK